MTNLPPSDPPPQEPATINLPGDDAPVQRILKLLESGSLDAELGQMRWSSNYTYLVSVCDDEFKAMAIYKPQRGERPLWDFPDGTLCYRERAAYILSDAIGWNIVPPTVMRDGVHGLGSVQFYIEHDPEVTYFNLGTPFAEQLQRIALFDFITNNADRKGGHCLLDARGKVWGIDHGICFHVAHKLRTVIWDWAGAPLPDAMLRDVSALHEKLADTSSNLYGQLAGLVSAREVAATQKRVERLLARRTFPQPGQGPNYPWPPV